MNRLTFFLIFIVGILLSSCKINDDSVSPNSKTRKYFLGFSPYPYDNTTEAQNYVYDKIAKDGDIINIQLDDGIQWDAALNNLDFHSNIISEWGSIRNKLSTDIKIILSVTPINNNFDGIAPYKKESGNLTLPFPWNGYNFNQPSVKQAYLNYCKKIIQFFNPDYFVMAMEVNLLINTDPTLNKWTNYLEMHQFVYSELKKTFPTLPILTSFSGIDLLPSYTSANNSLQLKGLNELINYTDYFAVTLYPFLSKYYADSLPSGIFDLLFSTSDKPICITGTGYPAEASSYNGGTIVLNGTSDKQNDFITKLFDSADKYNARFIINLIVRDYDKLWEKIGKPDDVTKSFRDTGLYDGEGNVRKAYETWKNKLNLKKE